MRNNSASSPITYDSAIAKFVYNPDTGSISWRNNVGRWGRIPAGSIATSLDSKGYLYVHIYNTETGSSINIRAHRLAWLLYYKEWPIKDIDHINRNRTDNRICNLRLVTRSQQLQNTSLRRDNKYGMTGVYKTTNNTYAVSIWSKQKKYHIGTYKSLEEAKNAYLEAKKTKHTYT